MIERILNTEIDYEQVNDVMLSFRKTSIEYLKDCLGMEIKK